MKVKEEGERRGRNSMLLASHYCCFSRWIEPWLKKWRQSVCVDRGHIEEYLRCQDTVQRLRETPCSNKKKSIMEALKTDLECSSTAASSPVAPSCPLLATLLLSLLFLLRAP